MMVRAMAIDAAPSRYHSTVDQHDLAAWNPCIDRSLRPILLLACGSR
jgi:hypothetical protein